MASAKEQAQKIAQEITTALQAARAAIMQAHAASAEFKKLLVPMRAEAEAARNVVEYPSGRYECKGCHQPVIFAVDQKVLPPCDACGRNIGYEGPPPKVLQVVPEAPRKFPAGLYECKQCRVPRALAVGVDVHAPCEFCGATEFVAV